MNKVNPKTLLHSKWTKQDVINKEKHFVITKVTLDDDQTICECIIPSCIKNWSFSEN